MQKFFIVPAFVAGAVALSLASVSQATPYQTTGHTDIRFTYENGIPNIAYYLDVGSMVGGQAISAANPMGGMPVTVTGGATKIIFQPSQLITYVSEPSLSRPAGTAWDFTGALAGDPIWYIPQTQDQNKPWTGISTESLSAADWRGNLTYTLTAFSGPGEMSVTTTGSFGSQNVYFQTSNGLSTADAISVPVNTHAHYNWFFTAEGVYTFELTASGTLANGTPVSVADTFTFVVGDASVPEPATAGILGITGAGVLLCRRRRSISSQ